VTDEQAFYGLLLREEGGWSVRSVTRSGRRWEAVIAASSTIRRIEAAAGASPYIALRTAWRLVERRLGQGEWSVAGD